MALGFTQHLTEMSARSRKVMFLGSRARPVRRADNLRHYGILNIPRPVTGIALLLFYRLRPFLKGNTEIRILFSESFIFEGWE
jgi:hypothetical protein